MSKHEGNGLQGRRLRLTLAIGSGALLAYIAARAHTVSFSYDEAVTYLNYVRAGKLILFEHEDASANHHLLNVWGMWLFMKLFGPHEFAMRIPNLIGGALYFYAASRLALRAPNALLALSSFVLLCVHPYLLDFFSLARGYGLSHGLLLLSLWQLYRFAMEDWAHRFAARSALLAGLAALASTMLLNYLIGLVGACCSAVIIVARRNGQVVPLRALLKILGSAIAPLAFVTWNASRMLHGKALYHGADDPWNGMIGSVAELLCYRAYEWDDAMAIMTTLLCLTGLACAAALAGFRHRTARPVVLGLAILSLVMLGFLLQNRDLGLPWPWTRTAFFLVPILFWLFVLALFSVNRITAIGTGVAAGLAIIVLAHFGRCANLSYALEWRPSGQVRPLLELAVAHHEGRIEHRPVVTMSCSPNCSPTLDFYLRTRGMQWMVKLHQPAEGRFPICDYHLVASGMEDRAEPEWTLIARSKDTGTALYLDERLNGPFDVLVHEERMPAERANTVLEIGIKQPSLRWVVPEGVPNGRMLVTGSVRALEQNSTSWLSLAIDQLRNGEVIDRMDLASHAQVRSYGEWFTAGIAFMPRDLHLGDELRFTVTPYLLEPRIEIGEVRLRAHQIADRADRPGRTAPALP